MPSLTFFKLRDDVASDRAPQPEDYLDAPAGVQAYPLTAALDFRAWLYVSSPSSHPPAWQSLLSQGFGPDLGIVPVQSVGALLILAVDVDGNSRFFAVPFGVQGRFLLKDDVRHAGYGLRTALNLIYPQRRRHDESDMARLLSVDAQRTTTERVRSRQQVQRNTAFETFDVDAVRDTLTAATGSPADRTIWGRRISGGDGLTLDADLRFSELGDRCRRIDQAHQSTDYTRQFPWLDNMQPVADPETATALEHAVIEQLRTGRAEGLTLELGVPGIVDWTVIEGFRYHSDRPADGTHPELRLIDYVTSVRRRSSVDLSVEYLKRRWIRAVNPNGDDIEKWSVWRSLFGEVALSGVTYVLEDGHFYSINRNFMLRLNSEVDALETSIPLLHNARVGEDEGHYNDRMSEASAGALLLMDRRLIRVAGRTSPIEFCDLLSVRKHIIHVKRHLGSAHLSHLFAQGAVSAELLQMSVDFRKKVADKIAQTAPANAFSFFPGAGIRPQDFTIGYAVVAEWRGRTLSQALPFFSKVNLRRASTDLRGRGYRVSVCRVGIDPT
jgi:uncharacterized protein (TIGR04141 family)